MEYYFLPPYIAYDRENIYYIGSSDLSSRYLEEVKYAILVKLSDVLTLIVYILFGKVIYVGA